MAEDNGLIPKILHYCWYGGKPLSRKNEKNIDIWKRLCSDFEIVRWDETNSDIEENQYVFEAYKSKKWAFVSDFFRLKAIYEIGGIYLDTDVELIKPLDKFLVLKGFMGFEDNEKVSTCIMGGISGHRFFQEVLELYRGRRFILDNGKFDITTNVKFLTELLNKNGLVKNGMRQNVIDMEIFPSDYFSPKSLKTGKTTLTENTVSIHHFNASWQTGRQKFHTKAAQMLGEKNMERIKKSIIKWQNNG